MLAFLFSLQRVSLIDRLLSGKFIGTRHWDNTLKRGGIKWNRVELAYGLLVQAVSFAEWKILGQVLSKCGHFFSFCGVEAFSESGWWLGIWKCHRLWSISAEFGVSPAVSYFLSITFGHKVWKEWTNRWSAIKVEKGGSWKKVMGPHKKDERGGGVASRVRTAMWQGCTCGFCCHRGCSLVWHLKCIWVHAGRCSHPYPYPDPESGVRTRLMVSRRLPDSLLRQQFASDKAIGNLVPPEGSSPPSFFSLCAHSFERGFMG